MSESTSELSQLILDYIKSREVEKLEKLDKSIARLKLSAAPADQAKLEQQEQKRREELEKFLPQNWLTDGANRAKQIQLVTHSLKYIHSDAKGANIYAPGTEDNPECNGLVCTSSLQQPVLDVSGNAAALDVGKLLQLTEKSGKALIDYIAADDISPLLPIAENKQQALLWLQGFKQALETNLLTSHTLGKQLFWPLNADEPGQQDYHLLAPLYATSLQQQLYKQVEQSRFSDSAKTARLARREQKYSETVITDFADLAVQSFGGTKPQNISQLNSQRYGKSYLLNSAPPPKWRSVDKPPLQKSSIFSGGISYEASKNAASLKWYLEHTFHRASNKDIRDERAERIDDIIEAILNYVAEVHQFPPGWSAEAECQLHIEEQLWLDPQRRYSDSEFLTQWDKKQWPEQIAASIARWLNKKIEGVRVKSQVLAPGTVEFTQWKVLVAQKIRLLQDDLSDYYLDDEAETTEEY